MKRTSTERAPARGRAIELQCPECTHRVRVPLDERVEGGTVYCKNCGNEAELTLGFDGETGQEQWLLLDPLADFNDDADARRI